MKRSRKQYLFITIVLVLVAYLAFVVVPNIVHHNRFVECEKAGNVLDSNPPQCVNHIPATCLQMVVDDLSHPECVTNTTTDVENIWLP